MIYLKRIFPNNLYAAKNIKVKAGKKEYNLAATNALSIPPTNKLYLKIDYHKTEIDITAAKKDSFYIVYLKPNDNNFLFFLRILFKNSLETKKLTEEEFNNYTPQMIYANQTPFELNKINVSLLFLGVAMSLFFVLFPLNYNFLSTDISSMSFWFGALSFMGFTSLFFLRNISQKQLYFRLAVFITASMVLGSMFF